MSDVGNSMANHTAQEALDRLQELAAMDDPEEAQQLAIAVGIELVTQAGAAVSWNKYESRVEAEMQDLRRAYDKTRKALLDAQEERGWLADQCNVLHSNMNASPPLGVTGWLEAAISAREKSKTPAADLREALLQLNPQNWIEYPGVSALEKYGLVLTALGFCRWPHCPVECAGGMRLSGQPCTGCGTSQRHTDEDES